MTETAPTTIELEVLRVASPDVIGETKPLSIATPSRFSNAEGDLKIVESHREIRAVATASAENFKNHILAAY